MFTNYLMRSKTAVSTTLDAASVVIALSLMASNPYVSVAKADILSGSSVSQENSQISVCSTVKVLFSHKLSAEIIILVKLFQLRRPLMYFHNALNLVASKSLTLLLESLLKVKILQQSNRKRSPCLCTCFMQATSRIRYRK